MIRRRIAAFLNGKPEKRAYTDLLTQAVLSRVTGVDSGALEIAAGTYSRALASAVASGLDARYFVPTVMAEIGRDLIEGGESVWMVGENTLRHVPGLDIEHPFTCAIRPTSILAAASARLGSGCR